MLAVIELDDRTHDGDKDSKRDDMPASAGYRIVCRISKTTPDKATIRAELPRRAIRAEFSGRASDSCLVEAQAQPQTTAHKRMECSIGSISAQAGS